ncbi:fluoride efflux transporter CrcB [Microvirga pudoricolor]|uniref:fluoride efflux transporter CrcB n=1 Tax=Microvirga pudoricolor TaxID=2778729 RepID=UPI001E655560|nr:fluoride efflux transporter CrcB [Microvirga pudoricolor]
MNFLLVFVGAGVGGALRHAVNLGCARFCGTTFPWGTLLINVAGSTAMGVVAGWLAFKTGEGWSQPVRLLVATGILGGFTTFSAFSLDAVLLWERGATVQAFAYVTASVLLSLTGLVIGLGAVRALSN